MYVAAATLHKCNLTVMECEQSMGAAWYLADPPKLYFWDNTLERALEVKPNPLALTCSGDRLAGDFRPQV